MMVHVPGLVPGEYQDEEVVVPWYPQTITQANCRSLEPKLTSSGQDGFLKEVYFEG